MPPTGGQLQAAQPLVQVGLRLCLAICPVEAYGRCHLNWLTTVARVWTGHLSARRLSHPIQRIPYFVRGCAYKFALPERRIYEGAVPADPSNKVCLCKHSNHTTLTAYYAHFLAKIQRSNDFLTRFLPLR